VNDAFGRDYLSAYLDGELSDDERERVEAQLAASPEWRAELADVRAARDALRSLDVRVAPPGFWDAVHAHVQGDDVEAIESGDRARRPRWRTWGTAVAVAAAIVAGIFLVPKRAEVQPKLGTIVAQHGAESSGTGDPISRLAPVGPFAGFRR
jgi:anti-sigma factor RsiW